MPVGTSPAPKIFQRKLTQALEDLPGMYIVADDMLVTGQGETQEAAECDHDEKLRCFLDRCRQQHKTESRKTQTETKIDLKKYRQLNKCQMWKLFRDCWVWWIIWPRFACTSQASVRCWGDWHTKTVSGIGQQNRESFPQAKSKNHRCSSGEILLPRGRTDCTVWLLRHKQKGKPVAFTSRALTQTELFPDPRKSS